MSDIGELPQTTRIAAYALVVDDARQILLVRIAPGYQAAGQWTLPGGGLNFGEDPVVGARRELEEETGLVGQMEQIAFVSSWTRGPEPQQGLGAFQAIQIVYHAHIVGGSIRHEIEESTDMAAWIPLAEARELAIVELVETALEHLEASELAIAD